MFIAYAVVAVLLALLLAISARGKLVHDERQVATIHRTVGAPMSWFPLLAACEIAGALGLLAGLIYLPLGIAAATGVVLYFVGAVIAHLRVGDLKGLLNPLVPLVFA
ncbi:MAG TPA: DoxX family protein, partial [Nocardioidaceae bacterium]|nr:DoxX family protein [Nocardioidaceae bacterium]